MIHMQSSWWGWIINENWEINVDGNLNIFNRIFMDRSILDYRTRFSFLFSVTENPHKIQRKSRWWYSYACSLSVTYVAEKIHLYVIAQLYQFILVIVLEIGK
jgi:hypothetical protein